ncbi:MAG: hypothetical protein JW860_10475 [Sedimentisphaerales bacterium]|nr:hypothetical protein [Sedimentisphaerales bacterium]
MKYYNTFRENVERDPSGYKTLETVLKTDTMDEFQRQWEKWVLELHFP